MCTGKPGHEVEEIKRKGTKLEHKKSVNTTFSTVRERNAFGGEKLIETVSFNTGKRKNNKINYRTGWAIEIRVGTG